jgi:hypothetical protein
MPVFVVSWSGSAGFEAESIEDAIEQAKAFPAWDVTSTFKAELLTIWNLSQKEN